MKVLLIGYGKINKLVHKLIKDDVVGIIDEKAILNGRPDIIIDFSHPDLLEKSIYYSTEYNIPILIGTTGYDKEKIALIKEYSNFAPVFLSENFSIGIFIIKRFFSLNIKEIDLYKKIIIETHNKTKKDSPSGTALMLSKILETNNIISKRVSDEITTHEVILSNDDEQIKITHNVFNKEVFAKGALLCGRWLIKQKSGLYNMEDFINEI